MFGFSTRVIAMIVGTIVIVVLAVLFLSQCSSTLTAKKQSEVSGAQGQASVGAGQVAVNTLSGVSENNAATDTALTQGQGEVRSAPEAEKGRATVNAACRFKANRNKPECQPKGAAR
jgi:cell division septation protein DedD